MSSATKTIALDLPTTEDAVRRLHAGDFVLLSGRLLTARDAAHKHLAGGGRPPCDLRGGMLYHCGPVVVRADNGWHIAAAGPTTSIREEPYMPTVVRACGLRGIIGKGGMGAATLAACAEVGCVYLHAIGGAAHVLAGYVKRVAGVFFYEEFGAPEAMWDMEVAGFPALVTMDTRGRSLHADVEHASRARLDGLLQRRG